MVEKISVILPIYKTPANYIEKSIESVLCQTYDEIELISIIDRSNTSNDRSIEHVLDSYKDDHRLITIFNKNHLGLSESANVGIATASGQYIARIDGDDINSRDRLQRQLEYLRSNKFDLVGSWALIIDESGRVIGSIKGPILPKNVRESVMFHNPFVHSSILSKKICFRKAGFYSKSFRYSEDYDLIMRIISAGFQCSNYPNYLLFLRRPLRPWLPMLKTYLRCKTYGYNYYGFRTSRDKFNMALSFIAVLIHHRFYYSPTVYSTIKKILNILFTY